MLEQEVRSAGPKVLELEQVANSATSFETSITIEFNPDKPVPINSPRKARLTIHHSGRARHKKPATLMELENFEGFWYGGPVRDAFADYAEICGAGQKFANRGTVIAESLEVKAKGASVTGKALKELALQAWCEAFGLPAPDFKEMKAKADKKKSAEAEMKAQRLEMLKTDPERVQKWNKIRYSEKKACDYKGADLQGLDLQSILFEDIDIRNSCFDDCNLTKADFNHTDFRNCSFKNAILVDISTSPDGLFSGSDFSGADMTGSSFTGSWIGCKLDNARLVGATVRGNGFGKASLVNTDFSGAELSLCDFKGADLSTVNFTGAEFAGCSYSADTKWPDGFDKPNGVLFVGGGSDPFLLRELEASTIHGSVDFDTFIEQLNQKCDKDRLKKSLKMLKSETFQLFSEVHDDSIVGIVKSQTDADLVYSCRLTNTGEFSCCTQNLNVCGGLRGALCKHLLVLLIGLAKAQELDSTKTYQWVMQSLARKPELNRDVATEVFMRYKGAEAGELDWRPTETMPEDYYAY
ncbi:MAG: pentapeptide repeat-containing protein [Candidatus Obscuribacterales bacterium]